MALSAFDRADLELDVTGHPLLNVLYYTLAEVLPSACVLFILRKLPPKRAAQQGYQQVRHGCCSPFFEGGEGEGYRCIHSTNAAFIQSFSRARSAGLRNGRGHSKGK